MRETAEHLNNQAISLAAQGEFSDAIACFKRAITIESANYLLWFNLGVTYRDIGDLKKAKDALRKAYQINDEDEETIETLALVCYNLHQLDDALMYCAEGLDCNPENPHLWNTMGVIYFKRDSYENAAEAFEHAVSLNPYYYDALYNLRDTYEALGNKTGMAECTLRMREIERQGGNLR
ncbi:MAG: tetratricopeptide repeat protein [Treponema sp.]|nr:tetratricopeptide repeat protein [Treponema sp.]